MTTVEKALESVLEGYASFLRKRMLEFPRFCGQCSAWYSRSLVPW